MATMQTFLQSQRNTMRVVDRIGGGDSFAAGLIHGFVTGRDLGSHAEIRGGRRRVEADHSRGFQSGVGVGS
jgi:hypothetical protein